MVSILRKVKLKIHFWPCLLICFIFSSLFFPGTAFPKEKEDSIKVSIIPKQVYQGEICVIDVFTAKSISSLNGKFQKRRLSFYKIKGEGLFRALIGIDMEAKPGTCQLTISGKNSSGKVMERSYRIRILKKDFSIQRLTLPKKMVELDKKTLTRVRIESKGVKKLWIKEADERLWHGKFIKPVKGEVISPFGVRRFLNNLPRSSHSGVDLKAKMGEEIRCPNTGIVVFVDDLYFSGKSVVVDHGQGLFTMYFHLSKVNVKRGEKVEKGKPIGLVGSSGRATGPHLHWGARLHGARVTPLSLLRLR